MKRIAILVPEEAVPAAILDPRYMFTAVNQFFVNAGKPIPFEIFLVGLNEYTPLNEGVVTIQATYLLPNAPDADLIFVPAIGLNFENIIEKNAAFFPWIKAQYEKGAEVASLCLGAFLLASTGLLDGKTCSTHWMFSDVFREMFPQAKLVDDKIITEQNRIYTSGGATSYWNLLLYLVEKYTNRETAILASKFFLLDFDKATQSQFAIFTGQKTHQDKEILEIQQFIETNCSQKLNITTLADKAKMSRRTFERRFKHATKNTVIEYVQRAKIEAAKKLLETKNLNVNEVMDEVGYSDIKVFREVFKKYAGLPPSNYKSKFNNPHFPLSLMN